MRRQWRLRACTALSTSFVLDTEHTTYIQIIRPLDGELEDGSNLASQLEGVSLGPGGYLDAGPVEEDTEMIEAEERDNLALRAQPVKPTFGYVTYEIHLHPTYRSPCLWFTLHGLPTDEPAFNIDTIFRRLVPDQYKDGLQVAGATGGISEDVSLLCCQHVNRTDS